MRYELRKCSEEDRAWAYSLKCEAYREVVESQFGPWNEEFQRSLFDARWNPAISEIVLVDNVPVGLIATEQRGEHVWIDEIQIAREWRARGIGSAIIQDIISHASAVRLQVLKKNSRAQKLYHCLSFCIVGETATHFVLEHRKARAENKPA